MYTYMYMYTVSLLMMVSINNLESVPLNCKLQNYVGRLTMTFTAQNFSTNEKLGTDWLKFG